MTMKNRKLGLLVGSFVLASLCGIAGAQMHLRPDAREKFVLTVKLSQNDLIRQEQQQLLSTLDVHGINSNEDTVQLGVDANQIQDLVNAQFEILETKSADTLSASGFDKYLDPSHMTVELSALQNRFPTMSRVTSIGKTTAGRDIWAIEVSSKLDDATRPAIMFNGMHHARELMTAELGVNIAKTLLEGYGKDAEVTGWLDSYRVLVVPQVNPDGNEIVHTFDRMWRKNGYATGGKVVGVDINRNYPALWNACNGSSGQTSSDSYRGPAAASEPEVKAMMAFVTKNKPVMNISYHAFSELVMYPFGCKREANTSLELFRSIGKEIKTAVIDDSGRAGTYKLGTPPDLLYEADGNDMDWQWREAGVLAFAMEINSMMQGFQPDYDKWVATTMKRQEGGWKALLRRMGRGGFRGSTAKFATAGKVTYKLEVQGEQGF